MDEFMLWFDNDPKTTLSAKIIRAVQYYTEKYGRVPNLCLIHPAGAQGDIGGIRVRPYRPVLPGHLWIGIEQHE